MQLRFLLALILTQLVLVLYIFAQSFGPISYGLGDLAFLLFEGALILLAFVMILKVGVQGKFGLMHLSMLFGICFVFLGTLTSAIYFITLNAATPVPSLADAFNFLGYVLVAVFALQFVWYFRSAFSRIAGQTYSLTRPSRRRSESSANSTKPSSPDESHG